MAAVQNVPFCVDESPYCIWAPDLSGENKRFLSALDPKFFTFQAEMLSRALSEAEGQYAAIALRNAYCHAVESALAMTFAALQAPGAMFAWLQKYRTAELANLCKKVANHQAILSRYRLSESGWHGIVSAILYRLPAMVKTEDSETAKKVVIEGYSKCLRAIGREFQEDGFRAEYNDIKHGFRISPGGFTLAFREEKSPGVEDPDKPWHSLGGSKYGSSVPKVTASPFQSHHLGIETISRNWDPSQMAERIGVLSNWLTCLKSSVQLEIGGNDDPVNFAILSEADAYIKPWGPIGGVINMRMNLGVEFVDGLPSKDDIIATYRRGDSDGAK